MSVSAPIVQVVAAVLLRRDGSEFLLACRPEGKVYAGYWEFPGGKMEPGETARETLTRELREELGITVTQAAPWLCRDFVYPHAHVHLQFWRVTDWEGEIGVTAPLEHSAVTWQPLCGPHSITPMLPANAPILKALSLPCRMGITQAEENGIEAELQRLRRAIHAGLRLAQIRDRGLSPPLRQSFAEAVMNLVRPHNVLALVSEDGAGTGRQLARHIGAHGLHLTSRALAQCATRPDFQWVGASCHNSQELRQAERLELDYALLGPALPTASHPETPGMGWEKFAQCLEDCRLPVFALGGQSLRTLHTAQTHGAHGIAALRDW
jgi:8-oxo-dGTP diphosphatase